MRPELSRVPNIGFLKLPFQAPTILDVQRPHDDELHEWLFGLSRVVTVALKLGNVLKV
jgi:hypothetical protein